MGKISKVFYDRLIGEIPDRGANRVKVQQAPNGEVTIHFRNLKIVLHNDMQIREWADGFKEALEKFNAGGYFKQDL